MTDKILAIKTPRLLIAAILASVTASVCCLGPFLLLATGLSGAWMGSVMAVESFQPYLVSAALLLMLIAAWQLITLRACKSDTGCEISTPNPIDSSIGFFLSLILVLILITSEYWIPLAAGI